MSIKTPPRIEKTSTPNFPQFVFEWHPLTEKVYRIDIPGRWLDGEFVRDPDRLTANGFCIAEHCEHHARFLGFVQTYLRGYRKAQEDVKEGRVPR